MFGRGEGGTAAREDEVKCMDNRLEYAITPLSIDTF